MRSLKAPLYYFLSFLVLVLAFTILFSKTNKITQSIEIFKTNTYDTRIFLFNSNHLLLNAAIFFLTSSIFLLIAGLIVKIKSQKISKIDLSSISITDSNPDLVSTIVDDLAQKLNTKELDSTFFLNIRFILIYIYALFALCFILIVIHLNKNNLSRLKNRAILIFYPNRNDTVNDEVQLVERTETQDEWAQQIIRSNMIAFYEGDEEGESEDIIIGGRVHCRLCPIYECAMMIEKSKNRHGVYRGVKYDAEGRKFVPIKIKSKINQKWKGTPADSQRYSL